MLEAAHVQRVDMQVVDTMCASIHHTHKELQHCTTTPILIEVKLIWPRKIWVSECAQEAEYLANWLVISHYIRWTGNNWHSKVARFEQVRCIASLVYAPESERIILLTCTGETAISSNSWCEIKKKIFNMNCWKLRKYALESYRGWHSTSSVWKVELWQGQRVSYNIKTSEDVR